MDTKAIELRNNFLYITQFSNKFAFQVLKFFKGAKPCMLMEGKCNSKEIAVSIVAELTRVGGETPRH